MQASLARTTCRWTLRFGFGAAVILGAGCAGSADQELVGPRAQRVGEAIEWQLEGEGEARAVAVGGTALRVVARRQTGEEFGFVLRPDGFEEWAADGRGRRDALSCRVENDREHYAYNGHAFVLDREDLVRYATFGEAMQSRIHVKRPYDESLLVENELGDELIRSLEALGRDPASVDGVDPELAARIIGEDGNCTTVFLQLAGACARLKCMYGGTANAVCNACTGALVGCAIIAILIAMGFG